MSDAEKQVTSDKKVPFDVNSVTVDTHSRRSADDSSVRHADNVLLAKLGYKSEFRREFSVRVFYADMLDGRHTFVLHSALRLLHLPSLLWA